MLYRVQTLFLLILFLTSCAFIETTPKTKSETIVYTTGLIQVTAKRTTALYNSGRISEADKNEVKRILTDSITAIKLTNELYFTDPESSDEYLDFSIMLLNTAIELLEQLNE